MVPSVYQVPRKVVVKCLEEMDSQEQPDKPGMLLKTTLQHTVDRFNGVFNEHVNLEEQVDAVMNHLERHTRRRRGESALKSGLLEWEQTSRVYELFSVHLNICERILFTMDFAVRTTILSRVCSAVLISCIFVSILVWMVSTLPSMRYIDSSCTSLEVGQCQPRPYHAFRVIESFCVYLFTVEYLLRLAMVHRVRFELLDEYFVIGVLKGEGAAQRGSLWSCLGLSMKPKDRLDGWVKTTIKHIFGLTNLIDLSAILPFWIEAFNPQENTNGGALVALRLLRITRIFRVFKLGRYSDAFMLFTRVMEQSVPALSLMTFFIMLGCGLFGTMIWFAEGGEWYPEGHEVLEQLNITARGAYLRMKYAPWTSPGLRVPVFEETPFESIIHGFWFVIVTITTVGYGDMIPKTPGGKAVGAVLILAGVIVLAMPIGVVGANFSREYYRVMDEKKRREMLKHQLDTLAAVEAEQDALIEHPSGEGATGSDSGRSGSSSGIEIHRTTQARQKLIISAEAVAASWYFEESGELSRSLRKLTTQLMPKGAVADVASMHTFVSMQVLEDLDVLSAKVHSAILAHLHEDTPDFTLLHARQCRWEWAVFQDECWQFIIEHCRMETTADPPQFFELRASVARNQAEMEAQLRSSAIHNIHRPSEPMIVTDADQEMGLPGLPGDASGLSSNPSFQARSE